MDTWRRGRGSNAASLRFLNPLFVNCLVVIHSLPVCICRILHINSHCSTQLPPMWDQLESLWRKEGKNGSLSQTTNDIGETADISDARNPAEIISKTDEGSEISGGTDGAKTSLSGSESKDGEKKDEPNDQDGPVEELPVVKELEEEGSAADKANVATQTIEADESNVKENAGRERKEQEEEDVKDYDDVNKAEETEEDLCDSGLEISGQEGSDNSDDSKTKKAEAKQGDDGSHPLEFSRRVLIIWTDPAMYREVRR